MNILSTNIRSYYYLNQITFSRTPKRFWYMGTRAPYTRKRLPAFLYCFNYIMSWLFSIPLRTVNNTKTQENVSVCTGPWSKGFLWKWTVTRNTDIHLRIALHSKISPCCRVDLLWQTFWRWTFRLLLIEKKGINLPPPISEF